MAPDVIIRKLSFLRQLLADLEPYQGATLAEVQAEHYKLERLFELLVVAAVDLLQHFLAEQGIVPESYRATFGLAGAGDLIPKALAERLQQAAGMRNILVHLYEEIDFAILQQSIDLALQDFGQFVTIVEARLDE